MLINETKSLQFADLKCPALNVCLLPLVSACVMCVWLLRDTLPIRDFVWHSAMVWTYCSVMCDQCF